MKNARNIASSETTIVSSPKGNGSKIPPGIFPVFISIHTANQITWRITRSGVEKSSTALSAVLSSQFFFLSISAAMFLDLTMISFDVGFHCCSFPFFAQFSQSGASSPTRSAFRFPHFVHAYIRAAGDGSPTFNMWVSIVVLYKKFPDYFSSPFSNSFTTFGAAVPFVAFMTCPIMNCSAFSSPFL